MSNASPALVLEERTLLSTITVTSAADVSGAHSGVTLRDAINQANLSSGADTIAFDPALDGTSIKLTQGQLNITDALTIQGNGARKTIIDAQSLSRVLNITSSNGGRLDVTLDSLTVTGGKLVADLQGGGGVYFFSSGSLNVINSSISGNTTGGTGGSGGGIYVSSGAVILSGSTLSGNGTTGTIAGGGGIYSNNGSITLRNSTLTGNSTAGEQSFGGGIESMFGNVTLESSTVAKNSTTGSYSTAGGIYARSGAVTLTNSILAANTIRSGGYPDVFIYSVFGGTFAANHSLIGNRQGLTLPLAPVGSPDANGNLIGSATSPIDPMLGPLANNGGGTQTMALLPVSPAIDQGGTTQLTTDQRGSVRVFGARLDMGAFELGPNPSTPTVSLAIDGTSLSEAGGARTITVTLSAASSLDTTIGLVFSGTATSGSDFTPSATVFLIPAGQLSGTVTLTAVQDTLYEGNETVVVGVTAVNANASGTLPVTATIVDDDAPPTVSLSLSSTKLAEGGGRSTVTAKLSAVSAFDTTINLAFSGTASNPADYTRSGAQIVIPAGQKTGSITLTAVQDSIYEGNETIIVGISSATNATPTGNPAKATITEDDPAPGVTLSVSTATIAEAGGTSIVTATLSKASAVDTTITLTFTGTATYKTDYTATATKIVIPAGRLTGSITLTAKQDSLVEGPEAIVVDVSTVTNGVETGIQQKTVTILDDDLAPLSQMASLSPQAADAVFAASNPTASA